MRALSLSLSVFCLFVGEGWVGGGWGWGVKEGLTSGDWLAKRPQKREEIPLPAREIFAWQYPFLCITESVPPQP